MIYVKINDTLYPASIAGKMSDKEWNGRESKSITMEADYDAVDALFPDGVVWSIITEEEVPVVDEEGNETTEIQQTEFDNSEFSIRGDLTVHTNGTCTIKMGKMTEAEDMQAALELLEVTK